MRLYLDTSVLGVLTDREDPRRMALTRRLLRGVAEGVHEGVISNAECRALFAEYVTTRVVPIRYRNDLRHVAAATIARVDALVSWNVRHLAPRKRQKAHLRA